MKPTLNKENIYGAIDNLVKVKAALINTSNLQLTPVEANHLEALYMLAKEFIHFYPEEQIASIINPKN